MEINAKEARQRFSELLDRAERGEEILITRRGQTVVRLVAARKDRPRSPLPDLTALRSSIKVQGSLTNALLKDREDARY